MKVTENKELPTISIEEIDTKKHFIVAKIDGRPCIGHQDYGVGDKFRFYPLNYCFTKGNHFLKRGSVKTVVKNCIKEGEEVHVFDNYKDALKWLIDMR